MTSVLATSLAPLFLLACPVSMGLMMWFMSRGMMGSKKSSEPAPRSTVEDLRAEQARLAAEIERREPATPSAAAERVTSSQP